MSVVLNGSSQYLTSSSSDINRKNFTVHCWLKTNSASTGQIAAGIAKDVTGNNTASIGIYGAGQQPRANLDSPSEANVEATHADTLSASTWTPVAIVADGTDFWVYHNGSASSTIAITASFEVTSLTNVIGALLNSGPAYSLYFDGKIAEVAYWNINLTSEEFRLLGLGVPANQIRSGELKHYYKLDDATDSAGSADLTAAGSPTYDTDDNPTLTSDTYQAFTTYTRTLDISGASNGAVPTDDYMWEPVESTTRAQCTYVTAGSQKGLRFAETGGAAQTLYANAIPNMALSLNGLYLANSIQTEIEVYLEDESNTRARIYGGYHYSIGDAYGSDGACFMAQVAYGGSAWQVSLWTRSDDASGFTAEQAVADLAGTTGNYARLRFTVTADGTTPSMQLEEYSGGAWGDIHASATATYHSTNFFGWAFGCAQTASTTAQFRGPNGANGPIITYDGPKTALGFIGQSEMHGTADTLQTATSPNLYTLRRQGGLVYTTDPWGGTGDLTGWTCMANQSCEGGWPTTFGTLAESNLGPIVFNANACQSALAIDRFEPAADVTARYNVGGTNNTANAHWGAFAKGFQMIAGDGADITAHVIIWQGTRDMVVATAHATYEASLTAIVERINAMWPNSTIYIGVTDGDRQAASGPPSTAEMQAISTAQDDVISAKSYVTELWRDSTWLGDAGDPVVPSPNYGWPNAEGVDYLHPGKDDNDLISTASFQAIGSSNSGTSIHIALHIGL